MKALWLDTGPLLELATHQLSKDSTAAFSRLKKLLQVFKSPTQATRFVDAVRHDFGEVRYSSGSLVELYKHARAHLTPPEPGTRDGLHIGVFWTAFQSLGATLERPFICVPLPDAARLSEDLARFGPVDAHLASEVISGQDCWLATIESSLSGVVAERSRGRVMNVWR